MRFAVADSSLRVLPKGRVRPFHPVMEFGRWPCGLYLWCTIFKMTILVNRHFSSSENCTTGQILLITHRPAHATRVEYTNFLWSTVDVMLIRSTDNGFPIWNCLFVGNSVPITVLSESTFSPFEISNGIFDSPSSGLITTAGVLSGSPFATISVAPTSCTVSRSAVFTAALGIRRLRGAWLLDFMGFAFVMIDQAFAV
jgi:hypothetical protein